MDNNFIKDFQEDFFKFNVKGILGDKITVGPVCSETILCSNILFCSD